MRKHEISALHFVTTLLANVDNEKLSDTDFRDMIRTTLPIVEKVEHYSIENEIAALRAAKYYPINEVGVTERVKFLEKELDEYFKGTEIKEYYVKEVSGVQVILKPMDPIYDEDYENDEMDAAIKSIGEKYKLNVKWTSEIYSK